MLKIILLSTLTSFVQFIIFTFFDYLDTDNVDLLYSLNTNIFKITVWFFVTIYALRWVTLNKQAPFVHRQSAHRFKVMHTLQVAVITFLLVGVTKYEHEFGQTLAFSSWSDLFLWLSVEPLPFVICYSIAAWYGANTLIQKDKTKE
ncbi:hypothetical protein J8L98_07565 [Pseudoalteromonas sp. MMG013]|uniref:hypothetical protein n=1 Tax=Pseudoalteromonas sp. MMG013 TaxID=2822687 RepID=UPI001B387601|nr:hypothetical protein [Pseudoalteromonas sp. MMG013]MBQ4861545.1 hypothetical protein [Pseudoalteromonas sp. MMG013]